MSTGIMLNQAIESLDSLPGAAAGGDAGAGPLSERDAATWDGVISDEEPPFADDCSSASNSSQSGILILPRVRSNHNVVASPFNLSLPGSVPSNIESLMLNNDESVALRSQQPYHYPSNNANQERKQVVPLFTILLVALAFLVLSLAPTMYLLWERNEVRSTALRLEEQLQNLQQQVQGKNKVELQREQLLQQQSKMSERRLEEQIQSLQHQVDAKTRQLQSNDSKARHLEEQIRKLQQQVNDEKNKRQSSPPPPPAPSFSFSWEDLYKPSSSSGSSDCKHGHGDSKPPKIDTCWVRANADFELGDCAVETKKSVKKKLKKLGKKLGESKRNVKKKLKTMKREIWRAQENFVDMMQDYKERYAEYDMASSYFDDSGGDGDGDGDDYKQHHDTTTTTAASRTSQRKENLHKIGKTATSFLSGIAFASAAALIVSGSFLGSVISDPDNRN